MDNFTKVRGQVARKIDMDPQIIYDTGKIWKEILESVKVSVSSANFGTWFTQTHIVSLTKSNGRFAIEIGCGTTFAKQTIETRYFGLIQDALTRQLEGPCDLNFSVKVKPKEKGAKEVFSPLFEKSEGNENLFMAVERAHLRKLLTFGNYAVSSSNQMAWAAAEAVADKPGISYNPLFVWGGVGVGKTHLMNAVGIEILKKDPESKVLLCTGEDFTNDIVEGIRNKTTQSFRGKYRRLNVLLIDDIQFIAGKDAVQVEFFHTFNAVTSSGGQIIMTSDKPPSEIAKLEERLKSRFQAGLTVDIDQPDFELRCAITQIKAKDRGIEIPMELIHLIAANIQAPREIEGFLTRLTSTIKLKGTELNSDLVTELLGKAGETNGKPKKLEPNAVIEKVCGYFSISKRMMLGKTRTRSIARPRQILMYLLRIDAGMALEEVGQIIGGRDHTTVMHAVDTITRLASDNPHIREDLSGIKAKL